MKSKRFWRISTYWQGVDKIVVEIPTARTSDSKVIALITALCEKHFLTDKEIVSRHIKKGTIGHFETIKFDCWMSSDPISYSASIASAMVHAVVVIP